MEEDSIQHTIESIHQDTATLIGLLEAARLSGSWVSPLLIEAIVSQARALGDCARDLRIAAIEDDGDGIEGYTANLEGAIEEARKSAKFMEELKSV